MAIETTTRKALFLGDGSSTEFSVPFNFFDDSDVEVYLVGIVSGAAALQSSPGNYSMSGNGRQGTGKVTFVSAPAATNYVLLLRNTPILQESVLADNESQAASKAEEALDRLTMIAQELDEQAARSAVQEPTATDAPANEPDVGVTDVLLAKITGSPTGADHPFAEHEPLSGSTGTQALSGGRTGTLRFPDQCEDDKTGQVLFAVEMNDSAGSTVYRGWLPGE